MQDFYAFADKKGVAKDEEALKRSAEIIKAQIKALIARDLYNISAYFYIINKMDDTFQKAVQSIKDNTFEKMKIAVR